MYPPIKYTITDQDINRLTTQHYPSLQPIIEKYPTGCKPLFNDTHDPNYTEDDPNYSTDNSSNEKKYSVNKLKVNDNEDNDYE